MDAAVESGRNSVSNTILGLSVEDEQADAGQDCRTHLARPNPKVGADRGQGDNNVSCPVDHEQDWHPYPVDLYSAIYVITIHFLHI